MEPFTWNADREILTAGRSRSRFGVGWRNYLNPGAGERWRRIDTSVPPDLRVTAFPGSVQFPRSSHSSLDMLFDGAFSMRRYIDTGDCRNSEPEFGLELTVETEHNVDGHIDENRPWQVLYPNAWDSAHLRLGVWHGRAARIEKVVEIHSEPSGSDEFVEYSFLLRSSTAKIWIGKNFDVRPWGTVKLPGGVGSPATLYDGEAFIARAESFIRGAMFRKPVAWYYTAEGERVVTPIEVRFTITAYDTVRAIKRIPRSLIQAAILQGSSLYTDATFTPDASPETSSVDGYTGGSGDVSWSTKVTQAGASANDSSADILNDFSTRGSGVYRTFNRGHLLFDTSTIGSGQQVDATTLTTVFNEVAGSGSGVDSELLNIYASSPASNTAIVSGDHLHTNLGTTEFATGVSWGTIKALSNQADQDWVFNGDGLGHIDMEGVTGFSLRWEADANNSEPSSPASFSNFGPKWYSAESAYDSTLDVTHSAASSGGPGAIQKNRIYSLNFTRNILRRKQV